ncbi:MAG: tetratricopeptide repeat protein [Candidatus Sericytochromatia bacterium]
MASAPLPDIEAAYQEALRLYQAGELNAALALYDRLLRRSPDDLRLRRERGILRFETGDYRHAIRDFSLCLDADPEDAWALYRRGRAYLELGIPQQGLWDLERTLGLVERGQELSPDGNKMFIYSELGKAYLAMGDAEMARYYFSQYELPKDPQAWTSFALVWAGLGNHAKAMDCLGHALMLDPAFRPALLEQGELYAGREDWPKARACYDALLALEPEDVEALCKRAVIWTRQEDYLQAEADCRAALTLDPGWLPAQRQWGLLQLSQGEYELAQLAYERALKLGDQDPASRFNLGIARLRLQDYAGAVEEFSAVLQQQPDNARALYYRNFAYVGLQNYPAAFRDFQHALALDPSLGESDQQSSQDSGQEIDRESGHEIGQQG